MNRLDIQDRCRLIKYELSKGTHTFTMCKCGRHGCRTNKCWECYLDEMFYNRLDGFSQKEVLPKYNNVHDVLEDMKTGKIKKGQTIICDEKKQTINHNHFANSIKEVKKDE